MAVEVALKEIKIAKKAFKIHPLASAWAILSQKFGKEKTQTLFNIFADRDFALCYCCGSLKLIPKSSNRQICRSCKKILRAYFGGFE